MPNEANDVLFEALTPIGFSARVTRDRWNLLVTASPPVMAGRRGRARLQDLIDHLQNPLGGPPRYLSSPPPVPDVCAAELDACKPQRGAAAHGDRSRFALAQIARDQRAVVLLAFCGVTEEHMRQFVKAA